MKGINEKKYRSITEQVTNNLPEINDWFDKDFLEYNKMQLEQGDEKFAPYG